MVHTEIQKKNNRKYYYRAKSLRDGNKIRKERIYLGVNLTKKELKKEKEKADKKLNPLKVNNALNQIKPKIIQVLKKNNVKKAGIFGSYSRGEQKKNSDVDILIEPPKNIGFGFFGIAIELEDKLGKKVDLISYNGINHLLKNRILSQEIKIL